MCAFTDKNQLLDAILRVKDGLDEFAGQLSRVTTDFPRAMDIIYYEQLYGRYSKSSVPGESKPEPPGQPKTPPDGRTTHTAESARVGFVVEGDIHIVNQGHETGEEILAKIEEAAQRRRTRGGRVRLTDEVIF